MAEPTNDVSAEITELPATKEKLDELTQAASLQYSLKNFSAAADHYADAAEIQSKLNGEMAPENAELLFNYGRALYKVAIAKSDVLGTKVAQEEKKKPKTKKVKKEETIPEEGSAATNGSSAAAGKEQTAESKPFFQLTGMENWDDSDEEGDDDEEGEGQEEEQDDFGDSFEMFEIARVLYHKQLETHEGSDSADKGKGKAELTPEARAIKEKLADIYGFLVDLSFENERFHDAIPDARTSLALLEDLYNFGHEKVTSAHYTLSLALEFASMAKIREQQANKEVAPEDAKKQEEDVVDWDLRNEASKHTELAINNQEAHLKKAEESLSSGSFAPEQKKELEAELADKKSMLEDLKTRLVDLKEDPTKQKFDAVDPTVFQGLLGGLLGADPATQKAALAEATKSANDISGLVKTRKKEKPAPAASSSSAGAASSSKRKLKDEDDEANGKRAKTEEIQ
ncbi:uncharacterized protein N0V89_011293 [Didymosphaeria variabile]|uniref:Tetratricopeptide SHNi-TPR domain-containing protein n=1 Tax=Didymosphaeria variabile TaxID=1932322 RepID=A0A9W8XDS2_9PLEO|nr:uncharacterized protein N0V89_011293 [Didymosphaeria variabile]KAJ4347352.1 hypothetical protein N0V89_011293 [Didymosphaeria variabile]